MSLSLKIKDATFTNFFSSLTLPSRSGLIGEYIFGVDAATSLRNHANPALPAVEEPSTAATPVYPTYGANTVTCMAYETTAGSYGINTGLLEPADCTVLVVRSVTGIYQKAFTAHKSIHVGSVGFSDTSAGFTFRNGSAGGSVDVASTIAYPAPYAGNFYFSAGVGRSTAAGVNQTYINGVKTTVTSSNTPISRGTDPFMVGGLTNASGFRGACTVAYGAIFNRLLSDAEIDAAYAQLKAFYALRGLTVS
jgi:hypothetical protein